MTEQPTTAAGRALLTASMEGKALHDWYWFHNRILAIEAEARQQDGSDSPALDVLEALRDWADDFDDGWGDRFAGGDFHAGGFTQEDHGDDHDAKTFRLVRAARLVQDR